jgi:predicted TIM-barrel enzyme
MIDKFLYQAKAVSFSGIQKFPRVGFIDGNFRANLEDTGITYQLEAGLVKSTHDKYVFTSPHVFCKADAIAIVTIGADIMVCHS